MPPFEQHLFVCTNDRPDGHPRGCCHSKGSLEIRLAFKDAVTSRGLSLKVRANAAGCLDACERGVTVVVYPEAIWYEGVQLSDVDEIVDRHLIAGEPVERLRWAGPR
ncbi:MAG: (2Fe-2S) ferredoxin domain-containing protein [Planctomycetota bacterium]